MRILDRFQIAAIIAPVNLATGANTGKFVSLKNFLGGVDFVFVASAGAAGEDPVITLRQATAIAGTGAKDLATITRIDVKQGADMLAIGPFSKITQAAAATYVDTDDAEQHKIYVIHVDPSDLDLANGYDCVSVNIADVGTTAQLGCVLAILSEPRYSPNASPIAD